MRIITLSGFSASVRQGEWTLGRFVDAIAPEENRKHFFSPSRAQRIEFYHELTRADMAIGKSYGAAHLWWMLYKHHETIFNVREKPLYVGLIDPHGAVVGDGVCGAYKNTRPLKFAESWKGLMFGKKLYLDHWRQTNGITGAPLQPPKYFDLQSGLPRYKRPFNTFVFGDSSHWDVTDLHKPSGRLIAEHICARLVFLETMEKEEEENVDRESH